MRRARGSVVELGNGGLGAARLEEQQEDVQKDGQKQGDEVSPYNSSDEDPLLQEYREAAASIYGASRREPRNAPGNTTTDVIMKMTG
jgi:hypothetical protein